MGTTCWRNLFDQWPCRHDAWLVEYPITANQISCSDNEKSTIVCSVFKVPAIYGPIDLFPIENRPSYQKPNHWHQFLRMVKNPENDYDKLLDSFEATWKQNRLQLWTVES